MNDIILTDELIMEYVSNVMGTFIPYGITLGFLFFVLISLIVCFFGDWLILKYSKIKNKIMEKYKKHEDK